MLSTNRLIANTVVRHLIHGEGENEIQETSARLEMFKKDMISEKLKCDLVMRLLSLTMEMNRQVRLISIRPLRNKEGMRITMVN